MVAITPEVYTSMGLNDFEYTRIVELLGRQPRYTELGMFAVMWSEHCGYKFSRPVLSAFKRYKEALEGKGFENAGIVDIGDGIGITMKVESHNHPSAVEPYQGAATGVGGILRDIFTMGARPIASLNSLRFGPITDGSADQEVVARNRFLFEHVVAGIAGYGNCVGVPTVAGEIEFHPRYSGNPLVNAMAVGILKLDKIATAEAAGPGNPVIYLGSATGKDGIHGATFASDPLGEDSDAKRPNVQIGDPFAEKLLIEATLEALETGAVQSIQDMGAAGLTCSTVEMSSKGSVGMEIDLDRVPMRESDMSGYELMLSESQERMLAVAHHGREQEILDVFHKWGLQAVVIGHVVEEPKLTVKRWGDVVADLDPRLLTDHCPTYSTPSAVPAEFVQRERYRDDEVEDGDLHQDLLTMLSSPLLASKRWVYEQFDRHLQTQTIQESGTADAAVLALRGTRRGIALSIDGNSRWTHMHPYRGGLLAVVEAARNVACTGAMPRAVTDGLNFGNPQDPEVYWQFQQAVQGIADAAEALETPVISGNVSLYNGSELGEVPPTPIIGMLGVLDDAQHAIGLAPEPGTSLLLVSIPEVDGQTKTLGASAYLSVVKGQETGYPLAPDLDGERRLHRFLVEGAEQKAISSAHDLSDGGLAIALAELAASGGKVAVSGVPHTAIDLFGEVPGMVVVGSRDPASAMALAERHQLTIRRLGHFEHGEGLVVESPDGTILSWTGVELVDAYEKTLPKLMAR
jgi:phosphoribosylformylglycinamidine synthase